MGVFSSLFKKHIFVSFKKDTGIHYKNLLKAWNNNNMFDFSFYDNSVSKPINSNDAGPIKRAISRKISDSTHLLCIVTENAHRSEWVKWEINKAVELGKKVVVVKTNRSNKTPPGLYGIGASWAMSFTVEAITEAIDK